MDSPRDASAEPRYGRALEILLELLRRVGDETWSNRIAASSSAWEQGQRSAHELLRVYARPLADLRLLAANGHRVGPLEEPY